MKNNDWKERLNIVYSTNPDYKYEMNDDEEQATLPPAQQRLRVQLDRKNRGGKVVTLVTGFVGTDNGLKPYTATSFYRIVSKRNYSARKVKRLKSTTFNSGSASFKTSLTVFLPSMMSSWFSKQTSFKNLPRRPLAIF